MIKIYGGGPSRWVRPIWTAREAGIDVEAVKVDFVNGEADSPAFRKLNPFGKVPVLVDGDVTLFESAAICTYLANQRPAAGLLPDQGSLERAKHDQWTSFAITELEQPLWRATRHLRLYPEAKRSSSEVALAKEDFAKVAKTLDAVIPDDYLVGGKFSVADILMSYTLKWASLPHLFGENLIAPYPRLTAYLAKHEARPSFPKELYPS